MVLYGLAILSVTILMTLFFKCSENRGKGFFLFLTILLVLLGILQRKSFPFEMFILQMLTHLITAIFELAPFALGVFSVAVIFRSHQLLKKRGWSRKYAFLFFMGSILLFLLLLILANYLWLQNNLIYTVEFLLGVFFLYLSATFIGFVFLAFLYRFIRPDLEKEYIIVLGADLLPDGRISSLLKYRLDEALRFHQRQKKGGVVLSRIIVSGGKEPDEPFSEAAAMKEYLVENGIGAEQILMEDQSLNTHQNFLYSKSMMEKMKADKKIVFITNNFHVLRSGVYARRAGVKAEGIGAKTPVHYLPYALMREYLALMLIYRTLHFYAVVFFLVSALILYR